MIDVKVEITEELDKVEKAAHKGAAKNLSHLAAIIRRTAIESFLEFPKGIASKPGTPPHTRTGTFRKSKFHTAGGDINPISASASAAKGRLFAKHHSLPGSIQFFVAEADEMAFVGPAFSVIEEIGRVHEFGGPYKGAEYPPRPFMLPALESNLDRIPAQWAGSIGE